MNLGHQFNKSHGEGESSMPILHATFTRLVSTNHRSKALTQMVRSISLKFIIAR